MKGAFTFVELVVVLAIIAVMTHLAVREVSHVRDGRLAAAADSQLETVRDCAAGFLADTGRLPRAADGTLSELWSRPAGVLPYAVREAVSTNLCGGTPARPGVYVPTGWRGPYLRLPIGRSRLMDPWGNAVEAEDSAGLSRLAVSNGFVVAVSHFGPRGQAADGRTLSVVPERGASSRLFVTTTSASSTATASFEYAWYGPADGLVTGAVVAASCPGTAVMEGLTPGRRVLWDSVTKAARLVDVEPGDNMISVELP